MDPVSVFNCGQLLALKSCLEAAFFLITSRGLATVAAKIILLV